MQIFQNLSVLYYRMLVLFLTTCSYLRCLFPDMELFRLWRGIFFLGLWRGRWHFTNELLVLCHCILHRK